MFNYEETVPSENVNDLPFHMTELRANFAPDISI